jgi:hypothetical protein
MSFAQHLLDLVLWCAIVLAPVPLCLAFVGAGIREERQPSAAHMLLSVLTLWCATTALVGLFLLLFHVFTLPALLVFQLVIFVSGTFLLRRTWSVFRPVFGSLPKFSYWEWSMVAAFVFVGAAHVWSAMVSLPTAYDDFAFHLPLMAHWYQTHSLTVFDQFATRFAASYPFNWEIVASLSLLPLREDLFVYLPNLVAWLALALSVYLLALQLGASRIAALSGAFLVTATPIVYDQVPTMHVDLAFATFFMAATYFGIRFHNSRAWPDLSFMLIALGLLVGIKTPGIIYAAFLVAVLAFLELSDWMLNQRGPLWRLNWNRVAALWIGTGLLSFALLGVFWFGRNLVRTGSVIGTLRAQSDGSLGAGASINTQSIGHTALAARIDLTNSAHLDTLWRQMHGYLDLPFLGLVGLTLVFLLALIAGIHFRSRRESIAVLGLIAGTALLYWFTPGSAADGQAVGLSLNLGWQLRYALPFLGMLGIAAAAGASAFNLRQGALVILSLVLAQSSFKVAIDGAFEFIQHPLLLVSVVCACLTLGLLPYRRPTISIPQRVNWRPALIAATGAVVVLAVFAIVSFSAREERAGARRQYFYGIVDFIEKQTKAGDTIAYFASHRSYLFLGEHFDREVFFLRSTPKSLSQWIESLKARDIQLVAVGPPDEPVRPLWQESKERDWLQDPDGPFVYVFGDTEGRSARIFRLVDDPNEVRDDFNRPDAPALGQTQRGNSFWQVAGGAFRIEGGSLEGNGIALIDSGSADVVIDLKKEGQGAGIVFRYVNAGSYWLWAEQRDGSSTLYRYENGSNGDFWNFGAADSRSLRVSANGASIRVFRDGELAGEVTDPSLTGATKHGISVIGDSGGGVKDFRLRRVLDAVTDGAVSQR